MRGLLIFAHGSRVEEANEAVRQLSSAVAQRTQFDLVLPCFLELGKPELPEAVATMVSCGVQQMVIVPYFLTPGIHLQRDLPRLVADLCQAHPGVSIRVTESLDGHPALQDIVLERAKGSPL